MRRTVARRPVWKRPTGGTTGRLDDHVAVRWSLWLGAGVVVGLVLGFLVGLTRPRPRATM